MKAFRMVLVYAAQIVPFVTAAGTLVWCATTAFSGNPFAAMALLVIAGILASLGVAAMAMEDELRGWASRE